MAKQQHTEKQIKNKKLSDEALEKPAGGVLRSNATRVRQQQQRR